MFLYLHFTVCFVYSFPPCEHPKGTLVANIFLETDSDKLFLFAVFRKDALILHLSQC